MSLGFKILSYKSLCIEIKRMWDMKCLMIPVMIGATQIATKVLNKNLEAVPEEHTTRSL